MTQMQPILSAQAETPKQNDFSQKEKVGIILEEYKTLRSESIERHTAFMQLFTIASSGLVAALGFAIVQRSIFGVIITLFAYAAGIVTGQILLDYDTRLLSARLQEIEAEVNRRTNDQLLSWETTHGIENLGYGERLGRAWSRFINGKPNP
jgi:hypothetical protein